MNPENRPTPEEMGIAPEVQPATSPATPAPPVDPVTPPAGPNPPAQPPQPQYPRREPGYFRNLVNRAFRREMDPEAAQRARETREAALEAQRNAEDERQRVRLENPEGIRLPNTPAELVGLMEGMTAARWRELELAKEYGTGRMAWLKSFIAGERNFNITEEGDIQRRANMELAQKAFNTIFNKKMGISVGTMTVVGLFTAGVGLPAAAALFGQALGRGSVEAWHSSVGKERGLREDIARAQFQNMRPMREQAREASREDLPDNEVNQHIANLVGGFYSASERVEGLKGNLVQENKVWNRRRRIGEMVGAGLGTLTGIWAGFAGLTEKYMTMNLDAAETGSTTAHLVEKVNGAWNYVYNTVEEATKAQLDKASVITLEAGKYVHALGESGWRVLGAALQNMVPDAARLGAVFGGLYLGQLWERYNDKNLEANNQARVERQNGTNTFEGGNMRGQVPEIVNPAAEWAERFRTENKPVPAQNEVWLMTGRWNPDPDAGYQMAYRIDNVNYQTGEATVRILNSDLNPVEGDAGVALLTLEDLLRNGGRRAEVSARWMGQFGANDRLNIGATNNYLVDQNNRQLEPGDYRVVKDPNDDTKAILRQAGAADRHVTPFMMAMFGLNRFEPPAPPARPEGAPRAPLPAVSVRYEITNRDQLPEALRLRLPNSFTITEVDRENNVIDINSTEVGNAPDSITFDEWQQISQFLSRRGRQGRAPGGGGGAGAGGRRRP